MEEIIATIAVVALKEVKDSLMNKKCCQRSRKRLQKYLDKTTDAQNIVRRISETIDLEALRLAALDNGSERFSRIIEEESEEDIYVIPPRLSSITSI